MYSALGVLVGGSVIALLVLRGALLVPLLVDHGQVVREGFGGMGCKKKKEGEFRRFPGLAEPNQPSMLDCLLACYVSARLVLSRLVSVERREV